MFLPLRIAALLSSLSIASASPPKISLRASLGTEVDSNARRAIPISETDDPIYREARPTEEVFDTLLRAVAELGFSVEPFSGSFVQANYVAGAKRFIEQATEDLFLHNGSLLVQQNLGDLFSIRLSGSGRASRVRNGTRDYTFVSGGAGWIVHVTDALELEATASVTDFGFSVEPRLSYTAPRVGGVVRITPSRRFLISASLGHVWRDYAGNALVVGTIDNGDGTDSEFLTFCDETIATRNAMGINCIPSPRNDREVQLAGAVFYRSSIVLGMNYLLRRQRSSSEFENVDRHRVSPSGHISTPPLTCVQCLGFASAQPWPIGNGRPTLARGR